MNKADVVKTIIGAHKAPQAKIVESFAPSNIALIKYWGKRNKEINLPDNSSFSISLNNKGTKTKLSIADTHYDQFILNGHKLDITHNITVNISKFLDLFRDNPRRHFIINSNSNIPVSAGLASSASGMASLVLSLNKLFDWNLDKTQLSILARLGSGSACRSMWNGFVTWDKGLRADGMDSHGTPTEVNWPDLSIGLLINSTSAKIISSRDAMEITKENSIFYKAWSKKMADLFEETKQAAIDHDFKLLAENAELSAISMHATMISSKLPIHYSNPHTIYDMHKVWEARKEGRLIFFTQDAGPNIKLIFLKSDLNYVKKHFPHVQVSHFSNEAL